VSLEAAEYALMLCMYIIGLSAITLAGYAIVAIYNLLNGE